MRPENGEFCLSLASFLGKSQLSLTVCPVQVCLHGGVRECAVALTAQIAFLVAPSSAGAFSRVKFHVLVERALRADRVQSIRAFIALRVRSHGSLVALAVRAWPGA